MDEPRGALGRDRAWPPGRNWTTSTTFVINLPQLATCSAFRRAPCAANAKIIQGSEGVLPRCGLERDQGHLGGPRLDPRSLPRTQADGCLVTKMNTTPETGQFSRPTAGSPGAYTSRRTLLLSRRRTQRLAPRWWSTCPTTSLRGPVPVAAMLLPARCTPGRDSKEIGRPRNHSRPAATVILRTKPIKGWTPGARGRKLFFRGGANATAPENEEAHGWPSSRSSGTRLYLPSSPTSAAGGRAGRVLPRRGRWTPTRSQ